MDNIITLILITPILSAALYSFGISILIVSLNTKSIRSLRSVSILTLYSMILYICVWFLPLCSVGIILTLFTPFNNSLIISILIGIPLIILAIILFINLKFYRTLWPSFERKTIWWYGLIIVSTLPIIVWYSKNNIFIPLIGSIILCIISISILFLLLNSSYNKGTQINTSKNITLPKFRQINKRVIWLGIDSATWDIITPMIKRGRLPNFNSLINTGSYGTLKTFVPTHSPVIWTTKVTGKTPLKHQIRNFVIWNIKGMKENLEVEPVEPILSKILSKAANHGWATRRPVSSIDRKSLTIWNIASKIGYRVGVISWFVTDPVEKINGIMIPEFFYMIDSKRGNISSYIHHSMENEIRKIKSQIENRFRTEEGNNEVRERFDIHGSLTAEEEHKFNILKVFYFQDVLRMEITHYIIKHLDIDILMVYFHGVDAVQHHFWDKQDKQESKFKNTISIYYEYLDEIIGTLLKEVSSPKCVFVTSDHGHGPVKWDKKFYNKIMGREQLPGSHSYGPDGIFIASGEGVKKGVMLKDISVYDIVPTILSILSLPIGEDMDGRPISEIFDNTVPPIEYISSYEGLIPQELGISSDLTERQEILERLRNLGYIE